MTTQLRVAQAEEELKQAKAAQALEAKDALRQQLADIRKQLREAKATYGDLRKRIRDGEQQIARVQAQINEIVEELTLSMLNRPEVTEVLPNEPDVREWVEAHTELEARRDRAIQRREAIRATMPPLIDAARYEGNNGVIANLERSEIQLLRRISGQPIGASDQGGVFRVL